MPERLLVGNLCLLRGYPANQSMRFDKLGLIFEGVEEFIISPKANNTKINGHISKFKQMLLLWGHLLATSFKGNTSLFQSLKRFDNPCLQTGLTSCISVTKSLVVRLLPCDTEQTWSPGMEIPSPTPAIECWTYIPTYTKHWQGELQL